MPQDPGPLRRLARTLSTPSRNAQEALRAAEGREGGDSISPTGGFLPAGLMNAYDNFTRRGPARAARAALDYASSPEALGDLNPAAAAAGLVARVARNLPMDEASRMARAAEQGFNTRAVHGTLHRDPIKEFLPGSHFGTPGAAADRLNTVKSTRFSSILDEMPDAMPPQLREPYRDLTRRAAAAEDMSQFRSVNADLENIKNAAIPGMLAGDNVYPVMLRGQFPEVADMGNWHYRSFANELVGRGIIDQKDWLRLLGTAPEQAPAEILRTLRDAGIPGLQYVNKFEDIGTTSYMMADPTAIRSPWARFDPSKKGSADLLAGAAGATVAGGLFGARNQEEERY